MLDGTTSVLIWRTQVFEYDFVEQKWNQLGSDLNGDEAYEKFGFSAALSAGGGVLVVGSPFHGQSLNSDGEKE